MNTKIRFFGFLLGSLILVSTASAQEGSAPQCGGWDRQKSLCRYDDSEDDGSCGPGRPSAVSEVLGAPGRNADPLGNPFSGLARRVEEGEDDGFTFPDSARGLSTVCEIDDFPCTDPENCRRLCDDLNEQTYEEDGETKYACSRSTERNCIECSGDGCRALSVNGIAYKSFFRMYDITTSRSAVRGIEREGNDALAETSMAAACYGQYDEFDPKTRRVEDSDRRCVIDFPFSHEELRESQSAVGRVSGSTDDSPPVSKEPEEEDLWRVIPGGMSFAIESKARDGASLTPFFLQPPEKIITAIQQRIPGPLAVDSFQRGGDDTANNDIPGSRPFTQWLERLQRDVTRLLSPPVVRLRAPASWEPRLRELGLIDFRAQTGASVSSRSPSSSRSGEGEAKEDPRTMSIDVQLRAGEDISALLVAIARETLGFPLRGEPIPVVVPLGSPLEFRARAEQAKDETKKAKLLEYAEQIDRYRALRAQIVKTVSSLLGDREEQATAFERWMDDNLELYRAHLAHRAARLALTPLVFDVQREIAEFSDRANFPWCRTDLLTSPPIYSLLDPWYPGRPNLFPDDQLPVIEIPEEKDFIFDLTRFAFLGGGTLRIPVLKPVQIQLALDGESLPDLPLVPALDEDLLTSLRTVSVVSVPGLITVPEQWGNLDAAKAALVRAKDILHGRTAAYEAFWASVEKSENEDPLACPERGAGRCVHPEMDLLERVTRLTAMPGVLLREQLQVQGPPSQQNRVLPLYREIHAPAAGWQVVLPKAGPDDVLFDEPRIKQRRATIDDDGQLEGPYVSPAEKIYPAFTVPEEFQLIPGNP